MELRRRHGAAELGLAQHLAEEGVGLEQDALVEQDVVDADGALLAQLDVVGPGRAGVDRVAERVMGVVVEVGAGRHDPVDEPGLDQRHQARGGEPGGVSAPESESATVTSGCEDLAAQELRRFAQASRVVGGEHPIDQIGQGLFAGDRRRQDARTGES